MITKTPFGKMPDGTEVYLYTLKNESGAYVEVISYGGAVRSICVPDRNGNLVDVCLGWETLEDYLEKSGCLGAVIGRHANRIGGASFTLNGVEYPLAANNGPNNLHGGVKGFDKHVWVVPLTETLEDALRLQRLSPDMEEGFPGNLIAGVEYSFSEDNQLKIAYRAISDQDTVCAMTNHSYFNLAGHDDGSIDDTLLWINSDFFTENDANCLPTGEIIPVKGTPFDFTREKAIGRDIGLDDQNLKNCNGYDHNFIIRDSGYRTAAIAYSEKTGIEMVTKTTQPGMQLYTANFMKETEGKGGAKYDRRYGFCLETQSIPNGMAIKAFPKPILRRGDMYCETVTYKFNVRK